MQVIANFRILPFLQKKPLNNYVFGFEELENNLHPALQRRLFRYVNDNVLKSGSIALITTHSSSVIDMFASRDDAQIIHVKQAEGVARCDVISTYVEGKNLLDDLDVRASDLLQANGLVWLEGPSDRIYFNRWIELWSDGRLKEGSSYQCVYYGGKLLSHLSGDDPDSTSDELIAALRINRNAIILMDSDKREADGRKAGGKINSTKQRIEAEFKALGALPWITAGREIENYIPANALSEVLGESAGVLGPFEFIPDFLEKIEPGSGVRFTRSKVDFARRIAPHITLDGMKQSLDLADFMEASVKIISSWNDTAP